jgi:hemolysin III
MDDCVMFATIFREPASAWTHFAGLWLAVFGTVILLRRSGGDLGKWISLLIYGICLIACYSASTLYHGVQLPDNRLAPYVRLDSVGIFALIAGSYTPLAWNLMRGQWRLWTLSSVWATAAGSILLLISGQHYSPVMGTCVYLVMGWGVVICLARIAKVVSPRKLSTLILGGGLYSLGAVLNLLRWPIIWPGVFEAHALFHLFVIGGSLAHYWFILKVVLPLGSSQGDLPDGAKVSSWGAESSPTQMAERIHS